MAKINVTTKGGDKGTTSLGNGTRVPKDDMLVDLYGTIDECQAALGLARSLCRFPKTSEDIFFLEDYLFSTMAYFAQCDFPEPDPKILENMTARVTESINEAQMFVRPGDSTCGAALHMARTIARRAERIATPLYRNGAISEKSYIFLNRLSDVIYVISLKVDEEEKTEKNRN
jgi:cob(I)alamin adenosyltransferase